MANVLVLGGTKFFGKQLVRILLNQGHQVTIATRGLTSDSFGGEVERLVIDREDRLSLEKAFLNRKWDIVYDQSCFSPTEAQDVVDVIKGNVKRYIFTSTQAVYDFGVNWKEEDFNPLTFNFTYKTRKDYPGYIGYQEAKRAAEAVLFKENAFEVVAVRFPIVIGEDDYTERLKNHIDRVIERKTIGISNRDARYSFILSNEAADFLYKIGFSSFNGTVNPGCKDDVSLQELIQKIELNTNVRAHVSTEVTVENASPYTFPDSWSINTDRAAQLGYEFSDVHLVLDQLINYYLTCRR